MGLKKKKTPNPKLVKLVEFSRKFFFLILIFQLTFFEVKIITLHDLMCRRVNAVNNTANQAFPKTLDKLFYWARGSNNFTVETADFAVAKYIHTFFYLK